MTAIEQKARYRVGIDIGGTFTDVVMIDDTTGAARFDKVLSTPSDPSSGFEHALERILERNQVAPDEVQLLIHATTVATNTIIEGKGARAAFVTTAGFRDLLEIQRQIRPALYDIMFEKPPALVPRDLAYELPERLDATGAVMLPLDESAVRRLGAELRERGVDAVAVCFLHSYRNPVHERRAVELLKQELPGITVSASSEVAPQIREYVRASTTVINALIQPVVERYLTSIQDRLERRGIGAEMLLMQSNGGVASTASAAERPVHLLESGPAAGAIAAGHLGKLLSRPDVIAFDMGGTTAKAALIRKGEPEIVKAYEVGSQAGARQGAGRGSGYPISTPVIDLVEIGAGGGSIAWVDAGGALRVGPRSSGAEPGPACYGLGGQLPTVTDANLVLGRIDSEYFLGGEMRLDVERARHAIVEHCASRLGLTLEDTANGILEIANNSMINAIRLVSLKRGYDPREFGLVGFGGAGPLHVNRLAMEMEIPLAIIPRSPGTFSARGLLVTDLKHELSRTNLERLDAVDWEALEAAYTDLTAAARRMLERENVPERSMEFVRQAEMHYAGQSYELTVHVPARLTADAGHAMAGEFHAEHERNYGFANESEPIEIVNLRLLGLGRIARAANPKIDTADSAKPARTRPVFFAEAGGYLDCPIYFRSDLGAGARFSGPAIVEETDSTTVLHPGFGIEVDAFGNLLLRPQ